MTDRAWPEGYRVALLPYVLTDAEDDATVAAQAEAWCNAVTAAARGLGWDPTSPVAGFVQAVPHAFLAAVRAASHVAEGDTRPLVGVEVGSADASRDDLDAAAHVYGTAFVFATERRCGTRSGAPLRPPPGFEATRGPMQVLATLAARGAIFEGEEGVARDFLAALRDALASHCWSEQGEVRKTPER